MVLHNKTIAAIVLAGLVLPLFGRIKMGTPFSDGAVLQRGMEVPVWGTAEPDSTVEVEFGGAKKSAAVGAAQERPKDAKTVQALEEFTVSCEAVPSVEGREPSLLPKGKNFKLVWHDEFDGDGLDESKWSYRTNYWGRRAKWFAAPEDGTVEVKDGTLRMKLVKLPGGQFVSPQLQTGEIVWDAPPEEGPRGNWPLARRDMKREKPRFAHRYGYYECRWRHHRVGDL